jgi:hypothetical protein
LEKIYEIPKMHEDKTLKKALFWQKGLAKRIQESGQILCVQKDRKGDMMAKKIIGAKDWAKLTAGIATGETVIGIVLGHPELGVVALPFGAWGLGDILGQKISDYLAKRKIKKVI